MKTFSRFFILVVTVLFLAQPTLAQYGGYGQQPVNKTLLVDKMVGKPSVTKGGTIDYVDNLAPADPHYVPGQEIFFRIRVKNTSNILLSNVQLNDYMPAYLNPLEGPGTFDANTRTIIYNIGDIQSNEEKFYTLKMQILPQNQLPADKGLFCLMNKAEAFIPSGSNKEARDSDSSQFCIEKQVTGVTKVPTSGPGLGLALLGLQTAVLGVGMMLRRYNV